MIEALSLPWESSTTGGPPQVPVHKHLHMENKWELLVVHVPLQNYDLTGIIETQWNSLCGLSAAGKGKKAWEDKEVCLHRSGLNI